MLAGVWAAASDFHLDYWKLGPPIIFLSIIVLGCHIVRARLRLQTPTALIEVVIQFLLACGGAELLSYELGSLNTPWADAWLARADLALGFDWVGVNRWVSQHSALTPLLRAGYQCFVWQPAVILVLLSFRVSHLRLRTFLLAWTLALTITLAGLAFAPAQTAYVYYGESAGPLPELSAQVGMAQFETLEALRAGGLRNLLDQELEGLVAFPSFHTTGGILFVWTLWPLRWARWPVLVINGLMIMTVPIIGAHYLVDVLAGAVVAAAAILIASRADLPFARRVERRRVNQRLPGSLHQIADRVEAAVGSVPGDGLMMEAAAGRGSARPFVKEPVGNLKVVGVGGS